MIAYVTAVFDAAFTAVVLFLRKSNYTKSQNFHGENKSWPKFTDALYFNSLKNASTGVCQFNVDMNQTVGRVG